MVARSGAPDLGGPVDSSCGTSLEFNSVYQQTFSSVWHTARRMGVRHDAMDDVVQEVYLAVHRGLENFEARGSVRAWVIGIVMRVVSNYRRVFKRKGAGYATSSAIDDVDRLFAPEDDEPLECLRRREAARILREVFAQMPEHWAVLIIMVELEGCSAPEISEALGTPLNTVYSRIRAARKDFSRRLARRLRDRDLGMGWSAVATEASVQSGQRVTILDEPDIPHAELFRERKRRSLPAPTTAVA